MTIKIDNLLTINVPDSCKVEKFGTLLQIKLIGGAVIATFVDVNNVDILPTDSPEKIALMAADMLTRQTTVRGGYCERNALARLKRVMNRYDATRGIWKV